ncbi:hypothetical protein EG68_01605 [Paragonimus skrjabini miyazakii]|uniref:Galactosylgalactosylxylosylprotein 3-beta-glucuronosyltransferase n=1 Tax=Paragonimus skrjabini miyazakii TaxID=59628 RepID=A0A8S9Z2G6_9TREM|nr:hypothetical protein EG68_01605 [Paragonimus skrjabini miyazakii]
MRFSKRPKRCLTLVIVLFVGFLYVLRTYRKSTSETYSRVYSNTKIYILTATYPRLVQRAELTRLCNTLRNVKNIHWIVCEDSESKTNLTATLLARCGVPYTHLFAETPPFARQTPNMPYWTHPRGVAQRNRGLQWLREVLVQGHDNAVLYIADDDNTYSLDLFEEIRSTRRASTWPVGLSGELPWEGCVTLPDNRSHVSSMWVAHNPQRPFPIDMAGFAVNVNLVLEHPTAALDYNLPRGMQESHFLLGLGLKHWSELEAKADGCQKILVWHTRTADPVLASWRRLQAQGVLAPPIQDPV